MRNDVPQTKGVWVSLAYTRAFGTLGPKFKSWYAHHLLELAFAVHPQNVESELGFDECIGYGLKFRCPNRFFKILNHLTFYEFTEVTSFAPTGAIGVLLCHFTEDLEGFLRCLYGFKNHLCLGFSLHQDMANMSLARLSPSVKSPHDRNSLCIRTAIRSKICAIYQKKMPTSIIGTPLSISSSSKSLLMPGKNADHPKQ